MTVFAFALFDHVEPFLHAVELFSQKIDFFRESRIARPLLFESIESAHHVGDFETHLANFFFQIHHSRFEPVEPLIHLFESFIDPLEPLHHQNSQLFDRIHFGDADA